MRRSGVLMHISSLPSPYGIGTMGRAAYEFVNFLKDAGQSCWQILPVCPTSYGDSPYQSFSTFAGNPYFIDLDTLCDGGLLQREELEAIHWCKTPRYVDYGALYRERFPVLRRACMAFLKNPSEDFPSFCERHSHWLDEYALFMALKDSHNGRPWYEWEAPLKRREEAALNSARQAHADDIAFYKALQYLFFDQWQRLKAYTNAQGIEIIGDLPIYVALDSADVWANPSQFYLDDAYDPIDVAGCPPDAFSDDGQLWGNPLFRWDVMKRDGYSWWISRIRHQIAIYDVLRIDHFRGFESYYAIPAKDKTARNGEWRKGPGMDLFDAVKKELGELNIIAEDLGYLTPAVKQLVEDSGYPGMKVLQFAFDSREDSDYLPHNYPHNCVVYTGTHDNDTILGWMETADKKDVDFAIQYLRLTPKEGYHWGMMKGAWSSVGELTVVQMQDLLGEGDSARMNIPSTLGGNWRWRMLPGQASGKLARKIHKQMELYRRIPKDPQEDGKGGGKNTAPAGSPDCDTLSRKDDRANV